MIMDPLILIMILLSLLLFGANIYTQKGEEYVVDWADGTLTPGTHYIGAGTGAGSFVKGTNALFTEVGEARVSATKSQPTADKNQWLATQSYTGTKTITNAGVLTLSTAGDLLVAADGLSIGVNNGDSVQYTFTLEQT